MGSVNSIREVQRTQEALDSLGRTQIDTARLLGASDLDVLRTVSFPAVRDSLAVALLVVFVEALQQGRIGRAS